MSATDVMLGLAIHGGYAIMVWGAENVHTKIQLILALFKILPPPLMERPPPPPWITGGEGGGRWLLCNVRVHILGQQ